MNVIAKSQNIRMSARKLRLVADLVRKMSLEEARVTLKHTPQRAAQPILLTLNQAVANATNNFGLSESSLRLAEIQVTEGPTYKRWRAVSRGRANPLMKRTAHLRLVISGEKLVSKPKLATKKISKESMPKKESKRGTKS